MLSVVRVITLPFNTSAAPGGTVVLVGAATSQSTVIIIKKPDR